MDNDFKELEGALKQLTPKEPSDGMRWNLARRLADLEDAEKKRSAVPLLTVISSVAATVLVAVLVWAVFLRPGPDAAGDNVVTQPDAGSRAAGGDTVKPNGGESVVAKPKPDDAAPKGGMEFVKDEEEYPTTVAFEIKRHVTHEEDLGIVRVADQPPMRKVRRNYVSELMVQDPETGKTYRVQKPESETILIRLEDH